MSLMPGQYNLDPIILGAVWEPRALEVTQGDKAKDLTGCVVTMELYDYQGNLIQTLIDGGGLWIERIAGVVAPRLTISEVLSLYESGQYRYQLWITEVDASDKNRWLEGHLEVIQ